MAMTAGALSARPACPVRSTGPSRSSRRVVARSFPKPSPEQLKQMQSAYQQAMSDPEQAKKLEAMQEAMKDPAYQQQMMQMAQMMQSGGMQEKMAALKDDPEFADTFAAAQKEGMGGLMKLMNDEAFLMKLSRKLGGAQSSPAQPAAPSADGPEINNLMDAAKYGDLEAIEDFVAIGKDVNGGDEESRTPLHFAAAHCQPVAISMLVEAGANLESVDSKMNTPLHYAAGYGRVAECKLLLNLGASPAAKNETGKTPLDLAGLNDQNPVNADDELMQKLKN